MTESIGMVEEALWKTTTGRKGKAKRRRRRGKKCQKQQEFFVLPSPRKKPCLSRGLGGILSVLVVTLIFYFQMGRIVGKQYGF